MEDSNNLDVYEESNTYYPQDKTAPIINISEKTYKIKTGDKIDFLYNVTASDETDGNLTNKITNNINSLDFTKEGVKKVEYKVTDLAGNTSYEYVYVTVKKDDTSLIRLGQISVGLITICLVLFLLKYIKGIKLEKRFSKYTINSSKNKNVSLSDNIYIQYLDFLNKLSKILSKSSFLKAVSKRYEKYVVAFKIESSMHFIAKKIVVGFLFIMFTVIIELLESKLAGILEILISFIVGFYTLDLVYMYKYSKYKKKIQDDLLDVITLMNNSFKSGMSTIQAIDLVCKEVNGPIRLEFKKVSNDIKKGLDIEVAFKRFSNRIKSEEAIYLASSLSVLNKTGGNIIKVFSSIEKNMYNRKKLYNELKSLTSSSKMIMYVLIIVPPAFVLFINLINKDYFEPLIKNPLGIALLIIIGLLYITYILVVKRVLRVRGIK